MKAFFVSLIISLTSLVYSQFDVSYGGVLVSNHDSLSIFSTDVKIDCDRYGWEVSKFRYQFLKGRRAIIDTLIDGAELQLRDTMDYYDGRIVFEVNEVTNGTRVKDVRFLKHMHLNAFKKIIFQVQNEECGFRINGNATLGYSNYPSSIEELHSVELIKAKKKTPYSLTFVIENRPYIHYSKVSENGTIERVKKDINSLWKQVPSNSRLIFEDKSKECFAIVYL